MSNYYQNILERVEALLNGNTAKDNFATVTLQDGETELITDGSELNTGQAIYVRDSQGNRQAAPEGQHTLSDGRVVTVNSEGRIADIQTGQGEGEGEGEPTGEGEGQPTEPTGEGEGEGEGQPTGQGEGRPSASQDELEDTKMRVAQLEEVVREMAEQLSEERRYREELSSAYEQLSKSPADQSIDENKLAREKFNKEYKDLKLSERVQLNLNHNQ